MRKSFAHQLTKASAVWWFDMWGGWYNDPLLMDELESMLKIYEAEPENDKSILNPEVVFFADETGYANLYSQSPQLSTHFELTPGIIFSRTAMGTTGAPYDSCMVEDAPEVLKNYKVAVFPFPAPSEAGKKAIALCEEMNIPYLAATPEHFTLTTEEIRTFLKEHGVHLYAEEGEVVYAGNGYVGYHSTVGGKKTITLPKQVKVQSVFGADVSEQTTDTIQFTLIENGTALFSVTED